jgi:hypothetical protein
MPSPKKVKNESMVLVRVILKYPPLKPLLSKSPKERLELIGKKFQSNFKKLISTELFTDYQPIELGKRITGLTAEVPFSAIDKIQSLPYISHVSLLSPDKKDEKTEEKPKKFFCVKLILTMAFEGVIKQIEERYLIVKAPSAEAAEKMVFKNKKYHECFYLNSDGETVEILISHIENSYEADARSIEDFNNPNGVEVFFEWKKFKPKKKSLGKLRHKK